MKKKKKKTVKCPATCCTGDCTASAWHKKLRRKIKYASYFLRIFRYTANSSNHYECKNSKDWTMHETIKLHGNTINNNAEYKWVYTWSESRMKMLLCKNAWLVNIIWSINNKIFCMASRKTSKLDRKSVCETINNKLEDGNES